MMPTCCLQSFARKGIEEHFRLAEPGDEHTCPTCGRVYQLLARAPGHFRWTEVVRPLQLEAEDA